ncbi:hypothetical protein [Bradyrhizobium genosp. A]|uniref:hypothetical protein n=1 Tax=Bradyrhizobium genosp. A TaxID=83626 RepID=UPI003CF0F73C
MLDQPPAPREESSGPGNVQPGPTFIADDTKRCPVCGEAIWVNARKCTHCDTDFTWRAYLSFGNTTLALITALIAVLAASVPAIRLFLTPENSQLSGVFAGISTSGETVSMLFSNGGRRTGAINRINIVFLYERKELSIYPTTRDDAAIFIAPGQTVGAEFFFANARTYWTPPMAKNDLPSLGGDVERPLYREAECKVWIRGVNADGSVVHENTPFTCQDNAFQLFRKLLADEMQQRTPQRKSD